MLAVLCNGFVCSEIAWGEVDESGAYKTTVPIEVPAFYGLEPSIALSYNSNGGNDIVGRNWDLKGTSYITRASPRNGTPSYDETDVFFLDGMELIPCSAQTQTTSPSCTTGGSHSTKIESFFKILKEGDKWKIWNKQGTLSTYLPQPFSDSKGTYRWALSMVEDTHGNKVSYNYWCDSANECYLKEIRYGNSPDNSLHTRITFYYEQRPDPYTYATGTVLARIAYRLKTINIIASGSELRAYRLTYTSQSSTEDALLFAVKQSGRDAVLDSTGTITSGFSLPPRTFEHIGPSSIGYWQTTIDRNNEANRNQESPLEKLLDRGGTANWDDSEKLVTDKTGWFPVDMDNDGRQDFVSVQKGNAATDKIILRIVKPLRGGKYAEPLTIPTPWDYASPKNVFPGDFNGDGHLDFILPKYNSTTQTIWLYTAIAQPSGGFDFPAGEETGLASMRRNLWFTGDVNGDGKTDLMLVQKFGSEFNTHPHLVAVISQGNGKFFVRATKTRLGFLENEDSLWFVADANGDGKTDFMRITRHPAPVVEELCEDTYRGNLPHVAVETAISYGDGTFELAPTYESKISWEWPCSHLTFDRAHIGDFNGDGRFDFIFSNIIRKPNTLSIGLHTIFSKGTGAYDVVQIPYDTNFNPILLGAGREKFSNLKPTDPAYIHPYVSKWFTGDFNGDGATDLMLASPRPADMQIVFWPTTLDLIELNSDKKGGYSRKFRKQTEWAIDTFWRCSTNIDGNRGCKAQNDLAFSVFPSDINGDGRDDVAFAASQPPILEWNEAEHRYVGSDTTLFRADVSPNNLLDTHRWQVTDVNGDGYLDSVYVYYTNPGIRVYTSFGHGPGYHRTEEFEDLLPDFNDPNMRNWILADVGSPDGHPDGKVDLVYIYSQDGTLPSSSTRIYTLLSKGDGKWKVNQQDGGASWPLLDLVNWKPIDIDGDGDTDLVNTWLKDNGIEVVMLSSQGNGVWTRTTDSQFNNIPLADTYNWRPADLNGDGLGDLLNLYTDAWNTGGVRTLISKGNGQWIAHDKPVPLSPDITGWQVAELNGDGKSDLVKVSVPDVLGKLVMPGSLEVDQLISIGDGKEWVGDTRWPKYADPQGDSQARAEAHTRNWLALDANGDGLVDFVNLSTYRPYNSMNFVNTTIHSLINRGDEWQGMRETQKPYDLRDVTGWKTVDWDGRGNDGLIYLALETSPKNHISVNFLSSNWPRSRVTQEENGIGNTTYISYRSSAGTHDSMRLGSLMTLVDHVTTKINNNLTHVQFSYEGAQWSHNSGRFLGFSRIASFDGTSSLINKYSQTVGCPMLPIETVIGWENFPVVRTRFTYTDTSLTTSPPYTCAMSHRYIDECEKSLSSCRTSLTRYKYDSYGNVTETLDDGEYLDKDGDDIDDLPEDNRATNQNFLPNIEKYIVGLPAEESVFDYSDGETRVKWRRFSYDSQNAGPAAPLVGDLTTEAFWNDTTDTWVKTEYKYNAHGNRTLVTDPTGRWESTEYDTTHSLFPVKHCNALFCSTQEWDYILGKLSRVTDPNGQPTTYFYDELGRPNRTDFPDKGCIQYSYESFGYPLYQHIHEQVCSKPSQDLTSDSGLWTARYFDGLGRTYRLERAGGYTKELGYLGLTPQIEWETTWHMPDEKPSKHQYRYDEAKRQTQIIHEDGSSSEVVYGVGTETRFNELRNQKTYFKDVRGRVLGVQEQVTKDAALAIYDTQYEYDALDRLISLKDVAGNKSTTTWNSLGQKLESCNPDTGCSIYEYYDNGQLKSETDAKDQKIGYTYDEIGRLKDKTYFSGWRLGAKP